MRKLATILFAALALCASTNAKPLTQGELSYINSILEFRLSLRTLPSAKDVRQKIRAFKDSPPDAAEIGDECAIIAESMISTAEYNCEYEEDEKSPALEGILRPTFDKIIAYKSRHDTKEFSALFTAATTEVINSMMQFLPRTDVISIALKEKKEYDAAIEKEPDCSQVLMNAAFWYYFAPAFAGGSAEKAGNFFESAQENAKNDYERYYAAIYASQFFFEQKDAAACASYMAQAERVLPGTRHVSFIRTLNERGFSLFDYNDSRKRAKVKKALSKAH
ncbi:MAG: hypothetical protein II921_08365 [Treponema sp.]|nr:hypothetical protein [Treponema sp.]